MGSDAGLANCSPAGANSTALTPRPVGAVIVIVVGALSAPTGITSVCGPARTGPPFGPIVAVADGYGKFEHLSSPVGASREPMRSACGGGATGATDVGERSVQASAAINNSAGAITRRAFMSFPIEECFEGTLSGYKMGLCRGPCGEKYHKVTLWHLYGSINLEL